ncbi:hypothetical protein [Flavobacterium hydatis]|uniref:Uncharacterized protein n=1 Tax=Flavobacterium hydatis TaxID=991 RepID=A0A086AQ64_FLAHY|nr:hypothetical protein [Flavobacterium hydatis]KFF18828.1 hypothetical protein IW20_04470 [Flavobacterium hydatis]OXA88757.1 hypothetical protein B0A62_21165 [Flavobacterium hydatis]
MIKKVTVSIILFLCFYSCGKQEASTVTSEPKYEYDINSEQYSKASDTLTQYENAVVKNAEPTPDGQFEVYHYMYSNGNVTKAEINVLFVNGKKDELQVIIDTPDGQSAEINLMNPISLGMIKGMDSYIYTSTSDNNKQVNVFFHNGRKMMGMTLDNQSVVFMNTPNYSE